MLAALLLALAAASAPVETLPHDALPAGNEAATAYRHLLRKAEALAPKEARTRRFFFSGVAANLAEKQRLEAVQGSPLGLSEREIEREVIDFEAFEYQTYLSSGVFPKRCFGYFDERWDTAALEQELKEVVHAAVRLANAGAARRHGPVRLTDEEVAVTFIAEGGAILLRERQAELPHIQPVADIGMDDLVSIFSRHAALLAALDQAHGTQLKRVVGPFGTMRPMSYREALAATSVTWLDEKERAARLLAAAGGGALRARSVREQFAIGSLVGRHFTTRVTTV